ncbi:PqqD family protein [Salmonirosea aquatica]|uniref:PqqD family peptide modification chaperone n=1 Tax=Salmonirosea aquatica TaxID=2654236 RepID=A0A7C9F4X9_9BACT|nr:PqqD family peptide modification chaperone [Cytophagaceae bacterium SJW1-29]
MNELSNKKFSLSTAQVSSNMADEVVILNHDKGMYYGLSEVGALVWSALESGPKSFDELCELVMNEYEVDRVNCEEDIAALLDELLREKLVVDEA